MAEDYGGKATTESIEHWLCYRYGARESAYLDDRGPGADQEGILRFVEHKAFNSHYENSAICDMLVAIRGKHL